MILVNARKFVVIGAGGHSRVVVEAAKVAGFELLGIIDIDYKGEKEKILDVPVIGGIATLDKLDPKIVSVIVAFGESSIRAEHYLRAQKKGFPVPAVVHPNTALFQIISQSVMGLSLTLPQL